MCSIVGWRGNISIDEKKWILNKANERGRDGYGFWIDGKEIRSLSSTINTEHMKLIIKGTDVLGNFRATPTTEAISTETNLQPYQGLVHNGTIANDKNFADKPIDSMILPLILSNNKNEDLHSNLGKIKGSYAIAYFKDDKLILARNYKPIYYRRNKDSFQFASTPSMIKYESSEMKPYSTMIVSKEIDLNKKQIKREQSNKVVISASSGLDSTTVAYMLKNEYDVTLAYFRYGCLAEDKELDRIREIARHGDFDLVVLDMPKVMKGTITSGTYHSDQIEGTEYAMDWVSARNLLMLSILTAWAETNGYGYIAFGGNLEESGAYPDNEQEFGRKFNEILPYSTQNGVAITLLQPVSTYMKHEIIKIGNEYKTPYELTWSCYGDGDKHCDNCAPCYMRKVAFNRNGLKDPVFV